jgi:predicted signal transduction protein with EAL and GGDEF domain
VLDAVNGPYVVGGHALLVTASFGIAEGDIAVIGVTELLRCADVAMYNAKRAGKGRLSVYTAAMTSQHLLRTRPEQTLRARRGDGPDTSSLIESQLCGRAHCADRCAPA